MGLGGTVVLLALFSAIFFSWYFFIQARHKERLTLMEKGADASNFYAQKPPRRDWSFPWLKFGLLIMGIALGWSIGLIVTSVPEWKESLRGIDEPLIFAFVLLFGGAGMIIAHFTDSKKQMQD